MRPSRVTDDLVDAVSLRPSRCNLLGAGAAAVDEHHVFVLGLELVEMRDDFAYVVRLLAARDGDECSLGKMSGVLAVLSGALEVARPRSPQRSACRFGRRGSLAWAARPRRSLRDKPRRRCRAVLRRRLGGRSGFWRAVGREFEFA